MKIEIDQSKLQNALHRFLSIVEKKPPINILKNFLLQTNNDSLVVTASDMSITGIVKLSALIKKEGEICVNAKMFSDIIREMPGGKILLDFSDERTLFIKAGRINLKMNVSSASEYPKVVSGGLKISKNASPQKLLNMINKTTYACSIDEGRYVLNGVSMEAEEGKMRMVATDGYRLASVEDEVEGFKLKKGIVLPKKGLIEVKGLLENMVEDEALGIGLRDGALHLNTPRVQYSIVLVDGEYPDYNKVIPKEKGKEATIDRAEFLYALKRASLMLGDENKSKIVRLDFSNDKLVFSASDPNKGEIVEEMDISYKGKEFSIGFNASYLLDFASSVEEDSFIMEVQKDLKAVKCYTKEDAGYLSVIMPVRI